MNKMTCSIETSLLLQPPMSSPNAPRIKMSMMVGLVSSDHQRWPGYGHQYAKSDRRPILNPNNTIPWEGQPTTSGSLIPPRKGSLLSFLEQTAILGMDLIFLYVVLPLKLSSVYLQDLIHYHSISTELYLTVKEVQPCIHDPGVHWSGDVSIIQKQLT